MEIIGLIAGSSGDSLVDELHLQDKLVAIVCGRISDFGYDNADYKIVEDLTHREEIYNFFNKLNVNKVILGTGHFIAFELVKFLSSKGIRFSIDISNSEFAKDKAKFLKDVRMHGFIVPGHKIIDNYKELIETPLNSIRFPVVLKSNIDKTQPVNVFTYEEFMKYGKIIVDSNSTIIVEDYIRGNDCTVAISFDGTKIKDFGVTYYSKAKEYKLIGFREAKSEKMSEEIEKKIIDIARQLVLKYRFIGLTRTDFIVDEEIYLLEINTVMVTGYHGSAYPFFKKMKINIAKELIDVSLKLLED